MKTLIYLIVSLMVILFVFSVISSCSDNDDDDDNDTSDDDDNDDNDDNDEEEVWTDPSSGLMWQNNIPNIELPWDDAIIYCENFHWAGYNDWRLPTISELRSLIRGCSSTESDGVCGITDQCLSLYDCYDLTCVGCDSAMGPGSDGCYWPSEINGDCYGSSTFWSSSRVDTSDEDYAAWLVIYFDGSIMYEYIGVTTYVRCVR